MVRIISLARDTERRMVMQAEASGTSLNWDFLDAHTSLSDSLQHDRRLPAVRRGRLLAPAELGCYSSHYAAWESFVASQARQLIVLEDDTWVDWRFLEALANEDLSAAGIQYLRLCALNLPPLKLKGRLLGRYVVHYAGYPQGTQGYLLTRQGAQHMLTHCRSVAGPIDMVMDQSWWGAPPSLGLFPCPVVEKTGTSRIGSERFSAALALPRELFWSRQLVRLQEYVRLRAYRIGQRLGFGPPLNVDKRWM